MSGRRSRPATTRGSRARKRPEARRSAGMQAREVTSPGPMSSSRARRIMSSMGVAALHAAGQTGRPTLQTLQFGELGFVFGQFGAHAFDHLGRGFAEERLVLELAL